MLERFQFSVRCVFSTVAICAILFASARFAWDEIRSNAIQRQNGGLILLYRALARSYAENGDFDNAIDSQLRALEMAIPSERLELKFELRHYQRQSVLSYPKKHPDGMN